MLPHEGYKIRRSTFVAIFAICTLHKSKPSTCLDESNTDFRAYLAEFDDVSPFQEVCLENDFENGTL